MSYSRVKLTHLFLACFFSIAKDEETKDLDKFQIFLFWGLKKKYLKYGFKLSSSSSSSDGCCEPAAA